MIQPFMMKKGMSFAGALNFSFLLDAPAGKHGFVQVRDGHIYAGTERTRFYSFNMPFKSLYMNKHSAEIVSARLASAGINFVRMLDDEDPEQGTVKRLRHLEGTQMYVDCKAEYRGMQSPACYADYTEFLAGVQLDFAREMKDILLNMGVKCPINISNHAQSAADILSLDRYADLNQNNAYWNHPDTERRDEPRYHAINMVENDPRRTVVDSPFRLNLVTRLNHNRVAGKPFIAAEWNILWGTDFRSDGSRILKDIGSQPDFYRLPTGLSGGSRRCARLFTRSRRQSARGAIRRKHHSLRLRGHDVLRAEKRGAAMSGSSRNRLNFCGGWWLLLGDKLEYAKTSLDDSTWRTLTLPHDWGVEHPVDEANPTGLSGGFTVACVGLYRCRPATWRDRPPKNGHTACHSLYANLRHLQYACGLELIGFRP